MLSRRSKHETSEWGFDEEIEQTERLTGIWEAHADMHQGTAFGETIASIARGYRLQLEALRQDQANPGPPAGLRGA